MALQRVSTEDVGRRAGVSRTTVSFVLNNSPGKAIPDVTRQRVLAAATALGYHHLERSGAPRQLTPDAVALLVCRSQFFFSDAFINRIVEGMAQVLNRRRFALVVQAAGPREHHLTRVARSLGVRGVVLVNVHERDAGLRRLATSGLPVVAIGRLRDSGIPQVTVDNVGGAQAVTEHLVRLGHRNIAMVLHAPLYYQFSRERYEGYRRALREARIPYRSELVRVADFSEGSGYRQMRALLKESSRPTAVFGGSDSIAAGVLRATRDAGLRVPEDVSVVGFEDDLLSRYLHPPLTSLSLPAEGLGATAAGMVVEAILGERRLPAGPVVLPTSLAVRLSCALARLPPASMTRCAQMARVPPHRVAVGV